MLSGLLSGSMEEYMSKNMDFVVERVRNSTVLTLLLEKAVASHKPISSSSLIRYVKKNCPASDPLVTADQIRGEVWSAVCLNILRFNDDWLITPTKHTRRILKEIASP